MENQENKEKKQFICPYANMSTCLSTNDDEIDLLDLGNILWRRRFLIVIITVLITAIASAYAFLSPRIYEVKSNITPSFDLGIAMTPVGIAVPHLTLEGIEFTDVITSFQDRTLQAQFWDDSEIVKGMNSGNALYLANLSKQWFMQNLSIKLVSKKIEKQRVIVSLLGGDPDLIAELLNDFISYVDDYSARIVIDNLKLELAKKKLAIEAQIEMLRRNAERNTQRHIVELSEQMAIAKKLKIIEMPEDLAALPKYARGVNALQTEIDILRQRKNSDLFIEELSVLQLQLESIDKVDFSNIEISSMQAEKALVPIEPSKPKKRLIVALGLVSGVIFSVFFVFLVNIFQQGKFRKV